MSKTKTEKFRVSNDAEYTKAEAQLYAHYKKFKKILISVVCGPDRSVEQNALWSAMYVLIARTLEGWKFDDARAHCKLYCGIPILQRESYGFNQSFRRVFGEITTEAALRLMSANYLFPVDGFPVTRNFTVKQGCEYTDNIVHEFLGRVDFSELLKDYDYDSSTRRYRKTG